MTLGASQTDSQLLESQIKRWKARLESLTELSLPTDYPRPIPARIIETEHTIDISEATSLAILKLSLGIKTPQRNGVNNFTGKASSPTTLTASPFSILLGAFSVLLHRYTGEEDISVGSSSSSTNPLVLRMKVQECNSIVDVIHNVLESEHDASQDEIPFDALLQAFSDSAAASLQHPDESGGPHRQSLFKVRFFNMTDTTPDTLASTKTSSSTDMTIFISQSPSLRRLLPIQIKVVYNSVLFSESRISVMMNQLEVLLQAGAENPTCPIGKVSLIVPESLNHLPDPTANLHWDQFEGAITDIFAKNAAAHPDRICVLESVDVQSESPRQFSYKTINDASNVLAHHLIKNGIKREDVVVLYSYRGVDLVVAVMGVLKAGATFSVIDPAYPPARQNVYLQVSKPKGLVILKKAGGLLGEVRAFIEQELKIVCEVPALEINDQGHLSGGLNSNGADMLSDSQSLASTHPAIELGPDSIGTLSFTSGSTGIPKGVRGRHYSLTHFYPWMSEEFQLGENDRFTMLSGIAHDPIQRDIFTPLFLGAIICIPTAEDIGVPGKLAEWMAEFQVSVTHLTPAMGQLLSANASKPIPSLRHAFFVGDVLTKRDVMRLQHLACNTHVINMYGTTETQRAVSYLKIPPATANPGFLSDQKDIMPAGKGMKNVQLLVINKAGLLAGVGEVGEIYVRSGGLAEGYLALPEVTSEKFLMNPFVADKPLVPSTKKLVFYHGARDRMYRTGDLGRYRPDGNVECTGRADDQVKIRGFRIELKEIDTHLSQHPDVRENVTLVRRDKYEEKTLVSYIVPLSKSANEIGEVIRDIRNYLKQKLPSYAIPSVFVPLTRMPLTPNGKIDKNALPFPDTALAAAKGADSDNLSPLQSSLREVWAKLLKMPAASISLTDNFFDLGGHSILATQLVFEVRKALAVEAPLGMVYKAPVLNAMVAEVDYLRGGDLNMTQSAIAPSSASDLSPVSGSVARPFELDVPEVERDEIFDYAADMESIDDSFVSANGRKADYSRLQAGNPNIFVTGVTGFLGAFILASAFKAFTGANIYCLVRANSNDAGLERIVDNCKRHLVWDEKWNGRLNAIAGDLASEKFGCDATTWDKLCTSIDTIIHNGALVHWIYPYQKLKGPNVTGTLTALTMATEKRLIPIHFVSSTSVLDTEHYVNKLVLGTSVYESDDLQGSKYGLRSGYGQTKWVAEQLIFQARKRGVPATIIRPGYIVGDSVRGVTNTDDFIWRLVKGCVQLGQAPRIFNVVNMCSVDYVAECVVQVAKNPSSIELGVFHTWNPHGFKFDDLFAGILSAYNVQQAEYIQWRTSLLELTLSTADHALFPLLHFVLDDLPTSTKSPELDDENTRAILKSTGVSCPRMDELLPLYLGYLVHVEFLEAPKEKQFPKIPEWSLVSKDKLVGRSGQ